MENTQKTSPQATSQVILKDTLKSSEIVEKAPLLDIVHSAEMLEVEAMNALTETSNAKLKKKDSRKSKSRPLSELILLQKMKKKKMEQDMSKRKRTLPQVEELQITQPQSESTGVLQSTIQQKTKLKPLIQHQSPKLSTYVTSSSKEKRKRPRTSKGMLSSSLQHAEALLHGCPVSLGDILNLEEELAGKLENIVKKMEVLAFLKKVTFQLQEMGERETEIMTLLKNFREISKSLFQSYATKSQELLDATRASNITSPPSLVVRQIGEKSKLNYLLDRQVLGKPKKPFPITPTDFC